MYSSLQKTPHGNAKRVYPFWKTCRVCLKPFPCRTGEQALRNVTCSRACAVETLRGPRTKKPLRDREGLVEVACAVCGKKVYKPRAWLKRIQTPTCSRQCNGVLRGKDWAKHGHKGTAAVTPEGRASAIRKMTGPNNPAWKGGVTYFRKHGNYKPIKYVRCPAEFRAMARKDGYVMEHRLIVARAMGRCLLRSEVVHHVNHDPQDNGLENLQLFFSNQAHKQFEHHGSSAPIWHG